MKFLRAVKPPVRDHCKGYDFVVTYRRWSLTTLPWSRFPGTSSKAENLLHRFLSQLHVVTYVLRILLVAYSEHKSSDKSLRSRFLGG